MHNFQNEVEYNWYFCWDSGFCTFYKERSVDWGFWKPLCLFLILRTSVTMSSVLLGRLPSILKVLVFLWGTLLSLRTLKNILGHGLSVIDINKKAQKLVLHGQRLQANLKFTYGWSSMEIFFPGKATLRNLKICWPCRPLGVFLW